MLTMKCSTDHRRTPGRKPKHGPRTSVSYRLSAELLMALHRNAKCRGVAANELFCHFVARAAGVQYPVPDGPLMLAVTPAPLLRTRPGPTPFQLPDQVLARLRERAERLRVSVTALVISTLEKELAEDLTIVRTYLRTLQEKPSDMQEAAMAHAS